MEESLRERRILDDLVQGSSIDVNGKKYKIEDDFSRKLLSHIRSLEQKDIEAPFGKDKVEALLKASQEIIDSKVLESSLQENDKRSSTSSSRTLNLKKVSAYNFRGLQKFDSPVFMYDFKCEPYLITGVNGAGKTSLLNAIVWCLTGNLLWDRTMPSVPPKVDLKMIDNSEIPKTIKSKWPIQVALPNIDIISTTEPSCWVEIELFDDTDLSPIVVKRSYSAGKEIFEGVESLDPLSVELSLLMPGRVNHIQLTDDIQIGNVFFQISGLNAIRKYGVYNDANSIRKALTGHTNKWQQESDNIKQQIRPENKVFNENLPDDLKEAYEQTASFEKDPIVKANNRIEWLKEQEGLRLRQLSTLFDFPEEFRPEDLSALGKAILVAYENLKNKPSEWDEIQLLRKAASDWTPDAEVVWKSMQNRIKKDLQLTADWYVKLRETENLKLKMVAAKLLKGSEINSCPLCGYEIEDEHSLRKELLELNQADEIASKSVSEVLALLSSNLEKSMPDSFRYIKDKNLKEIIMDSYENNVGKHLKESVLSLKKIGHQSMMKVTFDEGAFDALESNYSSLKSLFVEDNSIKEQFESFESKLNAYNNKVHLVIWASKCLEALIKQIEFHLGYTANASESSLLKKLSFANTIAESAQPVQICISQLDRILNLFKQKQKIDSQIKSAITTKNACSNLSLLSEISGELLLGDLKSVETELFETYQKLYGGEDIILKKIIPSSRGRQFSISFWVGFRDMLVEAGGILNASRIRTLLWSYVFSLANVGKGNCNGDWLNFMIIDEPLTSLDQEHQRSFAQMVFNSYDKKQIIVASHDLRWPRELMNIAQSHSIDANFVSCHGFSTQRDSIRLSDWSAQLDIKWKRWQEDNTDIEVGRDYVAAVREWCEDELKDILIWASSPSLARDTLGPLINKLAKAYSDDTNYKMNQVDQLIKDLKSIEADLQNSHHGCTERKNIFQNQIQVVHKVMDSKIIDNISTIRYTIQHRVGLVPIT